MISKPSIYVNEILGNPSNLINNSLGNIKSNLRPPLVRLSATDECRVYLQTRSILPYPGVNNNMVGLCSLARSVLRFEGSLFEVSFKFFLVYLGFIFAMVKIIFIGSDIERV